MNDVDTIATMRVLDGVRADSLPIDALIAGAQPVLLPGLAREWALVDAGRRGARDAMDYLRRHDGGQPVRYSYGAPEIAGRPFYSDDATRLNVEVRRGGLGDLLDAIAAHADDPRPPTYYLASLPVDASLPGFRAANDLDFGHASVPALASIWIGNRVTASCHYDAPNNIACCAVGRRRFTVFPPDQIGNLYPGPLAPTPGGQVVSMVDFDRPDLDRFPRFAHALDTAVTAVLEPGDAVFIPSMWWHHVQGLDAFNVLVNYWWNGAPDHLSTPMLALYHALWTIRDRPECEKDAWRAVFEHYVFGPPEQAGHHLPEQARGPLAPIDQTRARQLRAMLTAGLNR